MVFYQIKRCQVDLGIRRGQSREASGNSAYQSVKRPRGGFRDYQVRIANY